MLNHKAIEACYDYAVLTRGDLDQYKHDRALWTAAFEVSVAQDWMQLQSFIHTSETIMDVGCGMAGVDVHAVKQFNCNAVLLDGWNAIPMVVQQDIPFMSRDAVLGFMAANSVPANKIEYADPRTFSPRPVDVVISLRSWCFHYMPDTYMQMVKLCRPRVVIVDLRCDRTDWRTRLAAEFSYQQTIARATNGKWERNVYMRNA